MEMETGSIEFRDYGYYKKMSKVENSPQKH